MNNKFYFVGLRWIKTLVEFEIVSLEINTSNAKINLFLYHFNNMNMYN